MAFISNSGYSQEEYEFVNTSSWRWSNNSDLQYYSNSTSLLHIYNNIAESIENKKNKTWSAEIAWLQIPIAVGKAYTITFRVKNESDPRHYKYKVWGVDKKGKPKEMWHESSIYWGLIFKCDLNIAGEQVFEINYSNSKKMNNSFTYTTVYDSDSKRWQASADIDTRTIKIDYDGNHTVKIYTGYGETLMKTIPNTKGLTWIGVKCGSAANIHISNFTFKRKTDFGVVLPSIVRATEDIENKNYSSAISLLTSVINTYYQGAIPYYYRARAYIGSEKYKSAIEDCDKGLLYSCDKELKEHLFFLRGFSKIMLNDDNGIPDMKQAGEIGLRFLQENNLLEYKIDNKVTQNNHNESQIKRTSSKLSHSSNRIPVLKKTK